MFDDDAPGFGVTFEIDGGASIAEANMLAEVFESAEAKMLVSAKRIEQVTSGMINLGGATAEVKSFGMAATRELAATAREARAVEKSGEAMVRQLERQGLAFGKSREDLRGLRAEEKALAAERTGNTDLANRLRAAEQAIFDQELAAARRARAEAEVAAQDKAAAAAIAVAAAEREAQAMREAAFAHGQFEAAARRGMAMWREQEAARAASAKLSDAARLRDEAAAADVAARSQAQLAATLRASHDAMLADAVAAEKMRAATDPLYASTARLNAEIAESTRLYHAGATAPAEYARQQEVLTGRLRALTAAHDDHAAAGKRGASSMTQLSFQINDVATMAASGAPPFQILATQLGQIVQVAQMAEGGVKGFAGELMGLATRFAPLAAVAAVAGVSLYQFKQQVEKDANLKAYVDTLGLTHKEMKKLGDVSVTTGDLLAGFWKAVNEGGTGKSLMSQLFTDADKKTLTDLQDFTIQVFKGIAAASYGLVVGSYRAAVAIWNQFPAALGDIFVQAVNGSVTAVEFLLNKGIAAVNAIARAGNAIIGKDLFGQFDQVQLGRMKNAYAGEAEKLGKVIVGSFNGAVDEALKGMDRIGSQTGKFATENAQKRYRDKANEIIADRTAKKDKPDKHAEQLAREAAAIEAQIRNLYALAAAYGVSGAAALIAEARVKAESQAIKQRADIEAAVDRQVRLAIAQRVSDAAKSAAAMRDEAQVQAEVNGMVAAGLVPAERANELVRERIADLPLLAAIEAAQQRGLTEEVKKATDALKAQQDARASKKAADTGTYFAAAEKQAERQLALQEEELRLIGATDMERVRAMATIQATQKLQADGQSTTNEYAKTYIATQVKIATGAETNRQAQEAYNASLTATGDLFDTIDQSAQSAAGGIADAFGRVGSAVGDALTIVTGFYADQARLQEQHAAAIDKAGTNEIAIARENRLFAIRSSSMQINAYGNMASAAKGFFKEGSAGYKAMAAAEKVYRVAQLAMSVASIIQNGAETVSAVANSATRATANAAEGISAQAKLPFPANIAAMAATGAALVAAGIAVFGGGGGGAAASVTSAEDYQKGQGTGSILGDASAKSESIGRSLDLMMKNSNRDLEYSSEMARSLRAIESGIGNLAAAVARETKVGGGLDASALGLGTNTSAGLLGVNGLFSKKITRELNDAGLQFDGASVASVIAGGITANLYQEVLKTTKKSGFLGIGGSTKTTVETIRTGADAGLTNEVSLLVANMRTAIVGAAGTIGIDGAAAMLDAFQINIGRISFKDLTSEEIEAELAAVFSRVGDDMAGAIGGDVAAFQRAGEGMLETLMRLAKEYTTVDVALRSIGMTFGAVGLASVGARTLLVELFGGLDEFTEATSFFRENFLSEAEQMAPVITAVRGEMDRLGLAGVTTKAAFKDVVLGLDLSTASGREIYAALMAVAPAFAKTTDYLASLGGELENTAKTAEQLAAIAKQRRALEIQLMEANGDAAGALAAKRADEVAALDETLRALQQQVYVAQDAAQAARDLAAAEAEATRAATALASQRRGLEIELMEATGDAAGALAAKRMDEIAALDATLRPLREQIFAAQDAAAAQAALATAQAEAARIADEQAAAAAQAAQEQAAAAAQLTQTRRSMDIELMEALGDASGALAAKRADELAGTDASLRALREQIFAAQDAAAANAALAQAQQDAASAAASAAAQMAAAAAQVASQRSSLQIDLLRAQGDETGAVAAERALKLEATDETLRALQQQVWAAQDARAAAEAAAAAQAAYAQQQQQAAQEAEQLRRQRAGMDATLLELLGDTAGATALRRQEELAALDASLRPLQLAIYAQEDLAAATTAAADRVSTARDVLSDAYKRESDALRETIDTMGGLGDGLRKFRAELGAGSDAVGDAYLTALGRFNVLDAKAARGDAGALAELEAAGKDFLTAARDRAGSLADYQRDVARVAAGVDRGIGATDEAIDYAQAQLDALKSSVTGLIDVNESVVSVRDAIAALAAEIAGQPASKLPDPPATVANGAAKPVQVDTSALERRVDENAKRTDALAITQLETLGKIQRRLDEWDGGGLLIRTDDDTPVAVKTVGGKPIETKEVAA
jgi:hypothetical protein